MVLAVADPDFFDPQEPSAPAVIDQSAILSLAQRIAECRGVVTNSVEFMRVMALSRREHDFSNVEDVTPLFRRPGGTMSFWPLQNAALIEASVADGLFAPIGVGFGKTLITLALPDAMESKRTVLLVPPDLKEKTLYDIDFYSQHFNLPIDRITIVKFSELSSAKKAGILNELEPDLVIVDEAHALRHRSSARTKRVMRYAKDNPICRWALLSGTMTLRSILDYAHLAELALRKNSPLPRGYNEVRDWAGALDVKPRYFMMPGVLNQLRRYAGEPIREGYRRRLVETPGVVATSEEELGTGLVISQLKPAVPDSVRDMITHVFKTWAIEDEELSSALEQWRVLRQVACGFYYHWVWPGGLPDYAWLEARADWNKEVRQKLKESLEGMDSPFLCAQAAERYRQWDLKGRPAPHPTHVWKSEFWDAWRMQKHKPTPPTEAVWLSDFLVRATIRWAKGRDRAIIWYEHKALAELLAPHFPHFGAGTSAMGATDPVILCSMRAQGTGKNLQYYNQNLFTSVPPNGSVFEQVTGRTHRPGQLADEVTVDWFGHTDETATALSDVIKDAEYIESTTGQRQKVLYATKKY